MEKVVFVLLCGERDSEESEREVDEIYTGRGKDTKCFNIR